MTRHNSEGRPVAITKKQTIEIRQVANGYIVMPAFNANTASLTTDDERLVFQTFAELSRWLQCHFDFRSNAVTEDA